MFGYGGHGGHATIPGVTVGLSRIATVPFLCDTGLNPLSYDSLKTSFSGGHKLGAVVERRLTNPTSR